MARVIVLDSGPLSLICDRPDKPEVKLITGWYLRMWAGGAFLVIPEVADYEVRRELIRADRNAALARLDLLQKARGFQYAPIRTGAMRRAAELWAGARRRGVPTASDERLDADVIVAAQALDYAGLGDELTVATENVDHLARFVEARSWRQITR